MPIQKIKTSMALFFINASYHFYKQTKEFEERNDGPNEDFNADAIGGIISSASFLECFINEVYTDIAQGDYWADSNIPEDKLKLIEKLWNRNIPRTARYSIMEKYDIFLELLGEQGFDKGKYPYQDASILIEIRNKLVHFEPKWTHVEDTEKRITKHEDNLEQTLRGRFKKSKMHALDYFLFPHYCLSSSCLKWAFETAKDMAMELGRRAKIRTILDDLNWDIIK